MWRTPDGMGWWMTLGGLFWILFWASLVYLGVSLWRRPGNPTGFSGGDALEIAKRRYAAGEITGEEFDEIRRRLETHEPAQR